MGKLIEGHWQKDSIITNDDEGKFVRGETHFRDTISQEHPIFKPESGRYHLYVSYACPWAHRTLIFRELKNLQDHISINVVHPDMLEYGWSFAKDFEGSTGDTLFNFDYLYQVYQKAKKDISTKVTVPVLWDKKTNQIVNNESSEIIRIFNDAFNSITQNTHDYYPEKYRDKIDQFNEKIYHSVNNGVYRTGFATKQSAYEEAVTELFATLDFLEEHLANNEFLVGQQLTEADIRLITTLLRFDIVYYIHFKCCKKRISDYPNLARYSKQLYQIEAIKETTHFDHIKRHYYFSHDSINPNRIVPIIEGSSSLF